MKSACRVCKINFLMTLSYITIRLRSCHSKSASQSQLKVMTWQPLSVRFLSSRGNRQQSWDLRNEIDNCRIKPSCTVAGRYTKKIGPTRMGVFALLEQADEDAFRSTGKPCSASDSHARYSHNAELSAALLRRGPWPRHQFASHAFRQLNRGWLPKIFHRPALVC